ncbi:MAG TPA: YtxH domain-containing protein [Candidatus Fimicola cottocaccae]|uniref:YtxH domain-containing protein n=1 Tax=Tyzzerella sp. An114 TaxID=1965545 RepID=UPI00117F5FC1|nr:YtxH domain-containing protein [Tyzzerella sp. An114]HIT73026.1 YtxH domain-containing protein [Candidatus Fimicola cottocaccae]
MKSFTTGLIAGSMAAVAGMGYLLSDKKTQKKMMNTGKKMVYKAENLMGDIADTMDRM